MRFYTTASAVLAIATSAFAQTPDFNPIYTPEKGEVVPAGETFEVTWSAPAKYKDGTISISLIGGPDDSALEPISDIASGIPNSDEAYQWAVDASLGDEATYGLVFTLESDKSIFQYSLPFKIEGGEDDGGEDDGKPTVTVSTATGTKTVSLTSCPPTSTSAPPTTTTFTPTPTPSTTIVTSTVVSSSSSPSSSAAVPPPATTGLGEPETSAPGPTTVPTSTPGAGSHLAAGPVALVGGFAMAFLAL